MLDLRALVSAGINMVRQHVPIVGQVADMASAVEPAREAVKSGIQFLEALKPHAPPESQEEIDAELTALRDLRDRVMAHADRTIASLGDG